MKKHLYLILFLLFSQLAFGQYAYRSIVATGNWNANTSWERSSNGITWVSTTTGQTPGANDTVYIQTGHTISLTQNESCYDLNLHNASAARLNLATFFLDVNGKLGCFSSAISTFPVTYTSSLPSLTTWINTTSGGAVRVVGNSRILTNTGQWGNNPPGWNLVIQLNAGQTVTTNTGLKLNRLTINSGTLYTSTGFDVRPDNGTATTGDIIIQNGAALSLGGAIRRTGTAGAQCDTVLVAGTLEIRGTSGTPGTDILNLVVSSGGKIKMSNTIAYTSVITNYTYNSGSSVEYAGTTAQTTAGELPATTSVKKLIINNAAGVTLAGTRTVTDTLQMIAGNITIPSTDSLILGTSANGTLIRTSGTIVGRFNRYIAGTTTGNVLFPVGTATYYRPVNANFVSAPMAGGNVSISHVDGGIGGAAVTAFTDGSYTINRRSNMYWDGTINAGLTATNILLSIDANGLSGITAPTESRIIGSADNGLTFGLLGGSHVSGSGSVAYRSGFQVIPMTFRLYMGGNATTNPLPVQLKSFSGKRSADAVSLNWETASEQNNKGFSIERSENGIDFEVIGFVKGNGNSSKTIRYSFIDASAPKGTVYYRLNQLDLDGNNEYSEIIHFAGEEASFDVFPNPFADLIQVKAKDYTSSVTVEVFDATGKSRIKTSGIGNVNIDTAELTSGIYFVRIDKGDYSIIKRIIKK